MKSKSFRNYIWAALVTFSVACYGYLYTQDVSDYTVQEQATATVDENEEEARVYLPDIALLKKLYDLAEGFLNR
ncbi:MAG: hypothetical protein CMN32_01545 [Saprospirales bacterium]|nr:hypothetical protein [Saprospirales bacterium]